MAVAGGTTSTAIAAMAIPGYGVAEEVFVGTFFFYCTTRCLELSPGRDEPRRSTSQSVITKKVNRPLITIVIIEALESF